MFDLMGKRNYFFALSIIIMLCGVVGYVMHGGFNYDIQFEGGTIIEMQMNNDKYSTARVEQIAATSINKKVIAQKTQTLIQKEGNKKIDMLIISVAAKDTLKGDEQTKLVSEIRKEYKLADNSEMQVKSVNPSIGEELKQKSLFAVMLSSILIILYIWIRFSIMSGLSAGVMAVLGLLHDIGMMITVYLLFNIPLNESFIAAVLTIMGYSMNDTIIIYDRIRENSSQLRKVPIQELVNKSIMQTLARSINTVVTVLICLITVYVFAYYNNISSIKEFSLPLIIGVASGCYSSIFVASPLWMMWKQAQSSKRNNPRLAKV